MIISMKFKSLSASLTKSLRGAVLCIAKSTIRVEDEDHESVIKKGEKFYLKTLGNKYYLIDIDGKDMYQFSIDSKRYQQLKSHISDAVAAKPKIDTKPKVDTVSSVEAGIKQWLMPGKSIDDPEARALALSTYISTLLDDEHFENEKLSELKYERKMTMARLSTLKRAKRQNEGNQKEQRINNRKLEQLDEAIAKFNEARKNTDKAIKEAEAYGSKMESQSSSSDFKRVDYETFEGISLDSSDYEESEIDGYRVIALYSGKNCIGLYYHKKDFASVNKKFKGNMLSFSENDPHWPYD